MIHLFLLFPSINKNDRKKVKKTQNNKKEKIIKSTKKYKKV